VLVALLHRWLLMADIYIVRMAVALKKCRLNIASPDGKTIILRWTLVVVVVLVDAKRSRVMERKAQKAIAFNMIE
jgi:hypothetical protein